MVNKDLDEHIELTLVINKRNYHYLTGVLAERDIDIRDYIKVVGEKEINKT